MKNLMALRLYMPHSAHIRKTRFLDHIFPKSLSHHLKREAHKSGVHQVLLFSVQAGYLPNTSISFDDSDAAPLHHPVCIELIDEEDVLRQFLDTHREDLKGVRSMLFHGEASI